MFPSLLNRKIGDILPIQSYETRHNRDLCQVFFLISLDTLRADHVGCYGYPRSITPYLDWFSKHSREYCRTVAPAPWTLPVHVSLFTGLAPRYHRVELRGDPALSRKIATIISAPITPASNNVGKLMLVTKCMFSS